MPDPILTKEQIAEHNRREKASAEQNAKILKDKNLRPDVEAPDEEAKQAPKPKGK